MLTEKYIDLRKSKLIDFSVLSKELMTNENNETKIKNRKSKIFLIIISALGNTGNIGGIFMEW